METSTQHVPQSEMYQSFIDDESLRKELDISFECNNDLESQRVSDESEDEIKQNMPPLQNIAPEPGYPVDKNQGCETTLMQEVGPNEGSPGCSDAQDIPQELQQLIAMPEEQSSPEFSGEHFEEANNLGCFSIENLMSHNIQNRKRPLSDETGLPETKRVLTDAGGEGANEMFYNNNDHVSRGMSSQQGSPEGSPSPKDSYAAEAFDIYNATLLTEPELFENSTNIPGEVSLAQNLNQAPFCGGDFNIFQPLATVNSSIYPDTEEAGNLESFIQNEQLHNTAVPGQHAYDIGSNIFHFPISNCPDGWQNTSNFIPTESETGNNRSYIQPKSAVYDFAHLTELYTNVSTTIDDCPNQTPRNAAQQHPSENLYSMNQAQGQNDYPQQHFFTHHMQQPRHTHGDVAIPAPSHMQALTVPDTFDMPTQPNIMREFTQQVGRVDFNPLDNSLPEATDFNTEERVNITSFIQPADLAIGEIACSLSQTCSSHGGQPVHTNGTDGDDDVILVSSTPGRQEYQHPSTQQHTLSRTRNDIYTPDYNTADLPRLQDYANSIQLELLSHDLWKKFHEIGTEMIITKAGRRMFPTLKVNLSGLLPNRKYIMAVDVLAVDNKRYRYAYTSSQWMAAGNITADVPKRTYIHPESPALGEMWMRQTIVFDKMKLTNNEANVKGHIILHSMHKYQPRIHLIECEGNGIRECEMIMLTHCVDMAKDNVITFVFPETEFTTVTAYQNQQITKLKIDKNPFAKGFRDTNRACKMESQNGGVQSNQACHIYRHAPPVVTVTPGQFPERAAAFRLLERPESTLLQASLATSHHNHSKESSQHNELESLLSWES